MTIRSVAILLSLASAAAVAQDAVPDLARRCEETAREPVPACASYIDPPALTAIGNELRDRGEAALEEIEAALPHSLALRRIAPQVLAAHPCVRATRILLPLLEDPDERVAAEAVIALGSFPGGTVGAAGDDAIEGWLLQVARARGGMVRHNALNAMAHPRFGMHHGIVDFACAALDDAADFVRHSACDLLARVTDPDLARQAIDRLDARLAVEPAPNVLAAAQRARETLAGRLR